MGTRAGLVVVFDSGVGGLPYLAAARLLLPAESFLYVADRAGFPYGTKTGEEVRSRVSGIVAALASTYEIKALVIACNTASQAALASSRKAFPDLAIVGTVPAIKPAAERSRSGTIGVMATARAVLDPYLDDLVARYAPGLRVIREPAQDLVEFVERRFPASTAEERSAAVVPHVAAMVAGGADQIVLACTHFLHLRGDIAAAAGPGVDVVDSREGVARRLAHILRERGALAAAPRRGLGQAVRPPEPFILTGSPPFEPEYGAFASLFGLESPRGMREGPDP
jgi:glutamate racemase